MKVQCWQGHMAAATACDEPPMAPYSCSPGSGTPTVLQSCSMVAHCSDFFQVCASSSFLVLTASSNKLMLSRRGMTSFVTRKRSR